MESTAFAFVGSTKSRSRARTAESDFTSAGGALRPTILSRPWLPWRTGALAVLLGSLARNPDGTDNVTVHQKRNTTLNGNRAMHTQHPQTACARRQCVLESLGRPLEKRR